MVAVAIVVIVGSVNDWQKERQFKVLNEKKDDRTVKVIREGSERVINVKVNRTNPIILFPTLTAGPRTSSSATSPSSNRARSSRATASS